MRWMRENKCSKTVFEDALSSIYHYKSETFKGTITGFNKGNKFRYPTRTRRIKRKKSLILSAHTSMCKLHTWATQEE
ncbi:hypothetical protein E2C01_025406 [Portunus trituberculatus]|uniref:Uncharacterized protein n=1 Tax=Portunus trituberculatus TaxID=210409 RepID=A0A5B7ED77_PORTR|nr:hypothetical protein [Portunus trituberculatus]